MDARDACHEVGDILIRRVHHNFFRRACLHHRTIFHDRDAVTDADYVQESLEEDVMVKRAVPVTSPPRPSLMA